MPAAQLDLLGAVDQRADEGEARGDRLGEVSHVLADQRLAIAELVSEYHRFLIFAQHLAIDAVDRMDGLGKETEFHGNGAPAVRTGKTRSP